MNFNELIIKEEIQQKEKQEKKLSSNKKDDINYELDIEDEFDYDYSKKIDIIRAESQNSNIKNGNNDIKDRNNFFLFREKRKSEPFKHIVKDIKKNDSIAGENSIKLENKKIQIYSYNLNEKEQNILEDLYIFEYMGEFNDIGNKEKNEDIEFLIIDYQKQKNNYKIYEYILEKKIIIDFTTFLLEYINENNTEIDGDLIAGVKKNLFTISINNIAFENRKLKKNIFNNSANKCINDYYFIISKSIDAQESRILNKIILDFFNANILKNPILSNRSKSADNKGSIKNKKTKIKEEFKTNSNNKIYLITREKTLNNYFNLKENYAGLIIPNYIYNSFLNGELLDLENQDIFNKYKFL